MFAPQQQKQSRREIGIRLPKLVRLILLCRLSQLPKASCLSGNPLKSVYTCLMSFGALGHKVLTSVTPRWHVDEGLAKQEGAVLCALLRVVPGSMRSWGS
jgi:hypothetical protein